MSYPAKYIEKLWEITKKIEITDSKNNNLKLDDAINQILLRLKALKKNDNKIMFIGNGGSAGICSHQAIDYWKNGKIPAIAFNDPSLLTCISNDYGYEHVFEKPIEMFAKKNDVLIAISSSGKSKNILNGAKIAKKKGAFVVTMSGLSKSNPLRKRGDLNFYVPSNSYGHVEISHLILSHTFLDNYMKTKI